MRWMLSAGLLLFVGLLSAGCAQTRLVTITTRPPDAVLQVDGIQKGKGPITENFQFTNPRDVHRVTATRLGYTDATEVITLETAKRELVIEMKPRTRQIYLQVEPVAATLSVDGKEVSPEPLKVYTAELEFTVDSQNQWTTHTIKAERKNYQPSQVTVNWTDRESQYVLKLEPLRKDLSITSTPSGAQVFLDSELIGTTPLRDAQRAFPADPKSGDIVARELKAIKPGYEPVELKIGWDDRRSDYHVELKPRSKVVRIVSDPPDAKVLVDGKPIQRGADGAIVVPLSFQPINEEGELPTFNVAVSKEAPDEIWEPARFTIGWDDGKSQYPVKLKEILTRDVPLLTAAWVHDGGVWDVLPRMISTVGMKDVTDGPERAVAVQLTQLPTGTMIDTLAVAPDGQQLLFTALMGRDRSDFRSQMFIIRTNGSSGADLFSDGKSLDLTPSYSPGGEHIVFSSNRAGRRMSVWQMAASGAPGITQLTSGEANDIWPAIDSDPRPRLFYQSMLDTRSDPRLFSVLLGTMFRTDMQITGMQPRISPKNDAVVFTAINEKTGKRDLMRVAISGGVPQNLTNTPDIDEFDPAWNRDGSRIAYVSDRGYDSEKRHNLDVWIMDVSKPDQPQQLTLNGSQDDSPAWDPAGNAVYFRSNRGGDWGIWKLDMK